MTVTPEHRARVLANIEAQQFEIDLASLSKPKAAALTMALTGGGLRKAAGYWHPVRSGGRRISGLVVADLGRDGHLQLFITRIPLTATTAGRARLTERGERLARALIERAIGARVEAAHG